MSSVLNQRIHQKMIQNKATGETKENAPAAINSSALAIQKFDGMIAPGGPFATSHLLFQLLYKLSCLGISIWALILDYFLSNFISTTSTEQQSEAIIYFVLKLIFSFTVVLACTPVAFVSFLVWFPLQFIRPRAFSYLSPVSGARDAKGYKQVPTSSYDRIEPLIRTTLAESSVSQHCSFFLASGNLCLMPEFTARINNLSNTVKRAEKIAAYLSNKTLVSQSPINVRKRAKEGKTKTLLTNSETADYFDVENHSGTNTGDNQSTDSTSTSVGSKDDFVTDLFPDAVDFLCLQEVFDSRATKVLLNGLINKFPYIIYDVTWPLHSRRMTLLSSGLCIASRFPFIDAEFHAFPYGSRDDKLCCKGLLTTKVFISKLANGSNLVGYLSNTHLQAWSRTSASSARCGQLSLIEGWMDNFMQTAKKVDEMPEIVLFNVITGDFNFDKVSYFDQNEQSCPFMQKFCDPCVDEAGGLHSWVIGTELNQKKMHEDVVRTPQGLQRMLVSELERHHFVASTMARRTSLQRIGDGKRKIDYILYKHCEKARMLVKDFKFFTGLATLSDHIPIVVPIAEHFSGSRPYRRAPFNIAENGVRGFTSNRLLEYAIERTNAKSSTTLQVMSGSALIEHLQSGSNVCDN